MALEKLMDEGCVSGRCTCGFIEVSAGIELSIGVDGRTGG